MSDGSVVLGLTADHVSRLTGLSTRQLASWHKNGFFRPRMAKEDVKAAFNRIYTFRELVGLKVIAKLRNEYGVSVQHLKECAAKLNDLPYDFWADLELHVVKGRVVFIEPETGRPREIINGQYVTGVILQRVIGEVEADIRKLRDRQPDQYGKIEQNRNIAHNKPTIAGTRIPTRAIKAFADEGYSVEQIQKEYPALTAVDIEAALGFESKSAA